MKLRVAILVSAVLLAVNLIWPGGATAQTSKPSFTFTADKTNVNFNESVKLSWTATNSTWCWGYRWSTVKVDPDGSGWVEPPTPAGGSVTVGPLTSDKTYSLVCGQPNNPASLQSISITVGEQALAIDSFSPASGAPGTTVIITGKAFDDIKSVKFNNRDAESYTVDSKTQITAVVQTGTSTGKISVRSDNTTVSSATNFTVLAPPKINSFTVNNSAAATISSGGSVTLAWNVTNATWCWGTGWNTLSPGSDGWVQPPDQSSQVPNNPTGSLTVSNIRTTTTFGLQCGTAGGSGPGANNQNPTTIAKVTVTVTGLPPGPPAPSGALPFIKVNGGDVFAGGWFYSDSTSCNKEDPTYQAPKAPKSREENPELKNDRAGAVITYGTKSEGGSNTNQSLFALGGVVNDRLSRYGFMTRNGNQLTFANSGETIFGEGAPMWGGLFEGETRQTHCIPDYFGTKIDLPKNWNGKLKDLASGQYLATGAGETPVVIAQAEIDTTQNVSLFIDGNAFIEGDIAYKTDKETINNIPKLAIVVRGNIYISPTVGQLDGFYIAQPKPEDNCDDISAAGCHGRIFTCHENNTVVAPDKEFLNRSCRDKQLVINGAVVAANIEFNRTRGDLTGLKDRNTPAEIINFTPEMILGGSFFHGPSAASSNQTKIDSIISLPPIF